MKLKEKAQALGSEVRRVRSMAINLLVLCDNEDKDWLAELVDVIGGLNDIDKTVFYLEREEEINGP